MGTDNGPPFSGYKFKEFAKKVGFKHVRVAPYAPWANETVEYFMQNLAKVLKTFNVKSQDWRTALYPFLKSFWPTLHSTTRESPAILLFNGRLYHTKLPDAEQQTPLVKIEDVLNTDTKRKQRVIEVADMKQHAKPRPLVLGDKVLLKQQRTNKTAPPHNREHCTITEVRESQIIATNFNEKVITQYKALFKRLQQAEKCDEHSTPTSKNILIYYVKRIHTNYI